MLAPDTTPSALPYDGMLDASRGVIVVCGSGFQTTAHSTARCSNDWGDESVTVAVGTTGAVINALTLVQSEASS